MKKFITTVKNIFAIKELRSRIIVTFWLLVVFRLGSFVVLPGVDPAALASSNLGKDGITGLLNLFAGGAFGKAAIFALGIMPYISASIIIQLAEVAVPYFQKLRKDGESGFKKKQQITRYLTILITAAQAVAYLTAAIRPEYLHEGVDPFFFRLSSIIILTAGTIFTMWLGEKIDDKGIGQGISLLIMIGIISRFPSSLIQEGSTRFTSGDGGAAGPLMFLFEMVILFFVVVSVVMLTEATRRIPVQYAKQVVGNKIQGGRRQYLPLKVNAAGVMPIIFAQALMFLPGLLGDYMGNIGNSFKDYATWQYNLVFGLLIVVFTYFYTAIQVNPKQMADELRRSNGFIPGVKPGADTSEYIDSIMSKITLPGSIWLAIVAILPALAQNVLGSSREFSQFYGGTSLLIMVGVILNTLQQINSYLLMRHYEGMMKSGSVKGRSQNVVVAQ